MGRIRACANLSNHESGARIGLILGTGWSDDEVLNEHFQEESSVTFADAKLLPPTTHGHAGLFRVGTWDGQPVVISQGRIHRHEVDHEPDLLRRWVGTLLYLMGRGTRVIITNAVGGNLPEAKPGMIALPCRIGGAEKGTPYLKSEFVTPDAVLPNPDTYEGMREFRWLSGLIRSSGLKAFLYPANYIMIKGPGFGGRADRLDWRARGFHVVGMSLSPELYLLAVENQDRVRDRESVIRVRAVQLVTDNDDAPTHEGNQAVAHELAPKLGVLLSNLLAADW